jgi:hypothetical protein
MAVAAVALFAASGPSPVLFMDVAVEAGLRGRTVIGGEKTKEYILETTGGGVAILDYDGDGWPDIFLVNGSRVADPGPEKPTSRLYRNNRDGTFVDVTEKAGLVRSGWGQGACVGDYNNDGHPDLMVTYYGRSALYRNRGDGTFEDVAQRSGLLSAEDRYSTGCAFLDHDRDGDLDVFVSAYVAFEDALRFRPGTGQHCSWKGLEVMCGPKGLRGARNVLYRNEGDGTFSDVSGAAGILAPAPAYGFTPLVLDYDADGWPDIYVANDSTASLLFRNKRDGTFRELGVASGAALTEDGRAQAGMGVASADYDGDGWLDIVKTNFDDDTASLYRNLKGEGFEDATTPGGLRVNDRYLGWGVGFLDFDRDTWPDLMMVNGHVYPEAERMGPRYAYEQPKLLYRNLGNGRFEDVSPRAGPGILARKAARGAAFGDLFNTGRIDVVVNGMNDTPTLLHDCAPAANNGLVVQLQGTRSNRSAIGARVVVKVGSRSLVDEVRSGGSFCSQNDQRLHFGLGAAATADVLEVRWPSGATEVSRNVPAGRTVLFKEGAGLVRAEAFRNEPARLCGDTGRFSRAALRSAPRSTPGAAPPATPPSWPRPGAGWLR